MDGPVPQRDSIKRFGCMVNHMFRKLHRRRRPIDLDLPHTFFRHTTGFHQQAEQRCRGRSRGQGFKVQQVHGVHFTDAYAYPQAQWVFYFKASKRSRSIFGKGLWLVKCVSTCSQGVVILFEQRLLP